MHPLLRQRELLARAQKTDTHLVAYCPVMQGTVGDVPELRTIAEKYDATPGRVSLAWLVKKEHVVPIPKSGGDHLRENFRARDLELDAEDTERLDAIDREKRLVDTPKGPWNW